MAESVPTNGPDALDETLSRLSKKPGVKAVVILDRVTGAILRTTGQLSFNASALPSGGSFSGEGAAAQQQQNGEGEGDQPQGLEDFAAKVWNWVNASGTLVLDLDTEDELKLLRLRTKKQELVIVPDPKYLLIVVHDTPPA
ncbi:Dynein light chain roadblock-type 1 [Colletotrichum siamense]|uniref:Dynein light chain roadblock-type 1 n=1 Tax=Colletotrichum siamense TaxID=690259 RepID=A0A9P5ES28_COLSI|nr:Dynein light chain roadblock-type 1 [Colletotrichum siamense]KAF4842454.1 Dynein light chain roadblock-type 1 [Colletotrichum siamense]KAF4858371.1 Dynein light chain roadblock-type 1 [Colletotrichum siamense]KAF5489729.1 Dynein light chain roadblock-type 1 [Colletotrichum siamense]